MANNGLHRFPHAAEIAQIAASETLRTNHTNPMVVIDAAITKVSESVCRARARPRLRTCHAPLLIPHTHTLTLLPSTSTPRTRVASKIRMMSGARSKQSPTRAFEPTTPATRTLA